MWCIEAVWGALTIYGVFLCHVTYMTCDLCAVGGKPILPPRVKEPTVAEELKMQREKQEQLDKGKCGHWWPC